VSVDDPRLAISALAEPDVLLVFGALVMATSLARPRDDFGRPMSPNVYITPFGLAKTTGLSREVIERAAQRLVHAGLLKVLPDDERNYDSWRLDDAAVRAMTA
jgi:hypothetical protein